MSSFAFFISYLSGFLIFDDWFLFDGIFLMVFAVFLIASFQYFSKCMIFLICLHCFCTPYWFSHNWSSLCLHTLGTESIHYFNMTSFFCTVISLCELLFLLSIDSVSLGIFYYWLSTKVFIRGIIWAIYEFPLLLLFFSGSFFFSF